MRATEITVGRKFAVVFEHGEDFFEALDRFCRDTGVRAGHLTFIGGFSHARLVGTCEPLEHPERPLWKEIEVETLEDLGSGTLAWDPDQERVTPHIHVSAGLKADSADGRTSHLQGGMVQFLAEGRHRRVECPKGDPAARPRFVRHAFAHVRPDGLKAPAGTARAPGSASRAGAFIRSPSEEDDR